MVDFFHFNDFFYIFFLENNIEKKDELISFQSSSNFDLFKTLKQNKFGSFFGSSIFQISPKHRQIFDDINQPFLV